MNVCKLNENPSVHQITHFVADLRDESRLWALPIWPHMPSLFAEV